MKTILIIAKKELLDTLRDKRTLLTMIFIPLLVFPLIMNVMTSIQKSADEKENAKTITIGVIGNSNGADLIALLESREGIELEFYDRAESSVEADSTLFATLVRADSIDAAIVISPDFDQTLGLDKSAVVTLYYQKTESEPIDRLESVIDSFKASTLAARITAKKLDVQFSEPIAANPVNLSSDQEVIGKYAGGILPYFFIIFCFIGCMYPAIDMFTGEKERGTIETILTAPVSRAQILLGKLSVIVMAGLLSAILAMVGLFGSLQLVDLGPEVKQVAEDIFTIGFFVQLLLMLIPLTIFFAGIMIPITVYAKSFKEAQSIITPLNIAVMLPVIIGFLPGIELTAITAIIPVVNITLCTKEIVAGTLDYGLFAMVLGSLLVYASVACYFSFRQFGNEKNVLRS
jgi:sodium transport system permease protein